MFKINKDTTMIEQLFRDVDLQEEKLKSLQRKQLQAERDARAVTYRMKTKDKRLNCITKAIRTGLVAVMVVLICVLLA